MASKLKKKKKRKRERPDIMDYHEAMKDSAWENEIRWADEIMSSNRRLGLRNFKLDKLTKGEGSCFPIAVLQQLNREEVFAFLGEDLRRLAETIDYHLLRQKVKEFITILKWNSWKVMELKNLFSIDQAAKATAGEPTKTWEEYWESMLVDTEWADGYFIQATAWYLEMDIQIMDTKCNEVEPYYTIDGDFAGEGCSDILYIGYYSEVHYQSLMIDYGNRNAEVPPESLEYNSIDENLKDEDSNKNKKFKLDKDVEEKHNKDDDDNVTFEPSGSEELDDTCPSCKKKFKKVLLHIKKSKVCKISDADIRKLDEKSKRKRNDNVKKNMEKYRSRLRDEDYDKIKKRQNDAKSRSREKKRKEDPLAYKEQTKRDNESKKLRQDSSFVDRLRKFQEAVMYGPMFICVSCHGKMFRCAVKILTNRMVMQIDEKIPVEDCIDFDVMTMVVTESSNCSWPSSYQKIDLEVGERFICDTCLKYLKNGKLPPRSFKNSLALHFTDKELKEQDLRLTELEASLIAQNIVFQKIYQLPKSRWTGLKDKVINVPISNDAINNTLAQLPRTPKQAGLIGISLKRKQNMKNTHMKQLINPDKIFKMLQKLKESGSPYHQDLSTPADFRIMCNEQDKTGYDAIYGEEEEDIVENLMEMPRFDVEDEFTDEGSQDDEIVKNDNQDYDEDDEEEATKKDPIKKYHFVYDETLCMMDQYPEIHVSPGEGQKPKGILVDKHWDVKAFPHLHNLDGSNGKDQERTVRLKDQEYFIQRIINKEKRFAETPAYLYSSVAYLEEKRIYQSLSLVGSRGKEVRGDSGSVSYELEDEVRVLETIPNSPKYWQRMKYEILAKIENLGPFHLFFTLSCADMRWDATFATILSEMGYSVMFIKTEEDDLPKAYVKVKTSSGDWKPLEQFLEEDVAESRHELIRGNVVMATRYFHHRVKSFIRTIIMAKSNPMNVKNYTYKVEFQGRGKMFYIFNNFSLRI